MPSPAKAPRICIFGDSHLAAAKMALDSGAVDLGAPYEFWGADGPRFRQLTMQESTIHASEEAAPIVAAVNGKGRKTLSATDFDVFLFYGARLRQSEYYPPLLDFICKPDGSLSSAVRQKLTRRFLMGTRAYRFAMQFAKHKSKPRVFYSPTSFLTEGITENAHAEFPFAHRAKANDRDILRAWLDEEAHTDGITLIHQPEESITAGLFTKSKYAVDNAVAEKDAVHKNGAYGALILSQFKAAL